MPLKTKRIGRAGFALGYALLLGLAFATFALSLPQTARGLFGLLLVLCAAALVSLRCHDLGKTPYATFWRDQIPVVGPLVGFAELLIRPGTLGENQYGPAPLL